MSKQRTNANARRYGGTPSHQLAAAERDARAALALACELRARAEAGEYVVDELLAEGMASIDRAEVASRFAGMGYAAVLRILSLDAESSTERMQALFANPEHFRDSPELRGFESTYSRRSKVPAVSPLESAARFMADAAGEPRIPVAEILDDPRAALQAYRRAAKRLHPDVGGDTAQMQRLEEAKCALRAVCN